MPRSDIFDVILRLRGEGRAFAVATVVRTADVTSAKAGAKAAVTGDGTVLGIWAAAASPGRCARRL